MSGRTPATSTPRATRPAHRGSPRRVTSILRGVRDPDARRFGYGAMVALAGGYTLAIALLARQGATPIPAPFLRIPDEIYYLWAIAFTGPALLAGWLLATAVMQLTARVAGGTGAFEDLAGAIGVVTAIASLATLIPDLVMGGLGIYGGAWTTTWPGQVLINGWLTLYVVLFLVWLPTAVRAVHGLSRGRAAVVGAGGFVSYQGFIFIFVR